MATVSDNFNRTGNLDGSTASGGGTWDEFQETGWQTFSNYAYGAKATNYVDCLARLDVALDGDDHEVEVTWVYDDLPASSFCNVGLIARKEDNATVTFYRYAISGLGTKTTLSKMVAGSYTSLGDGATDPAVTDNIRLKCDGSTITGYLNDGSEVSVSDSAIAGAGYVQVGLIVDPGNQVGGMGMDNWAAADLAGGTLYYQSAAGTITPAGAPSKQGQKPIAGTLTSAGAIVKTTAKPLAGALSSAGTVTKGLYLSLAGTLTTSGAVASVKIALKSLAGTLTSAGAITKETAKPLAGALTSAGAIVKTTAKPLAGALTSAGAVVKETATSLAGTLTTSGALAAAKQAAGLYYQAVAGTLTSAGAIVKTTAKPLAGTLSSAGTVAKGLYLSLAGTLISAGAVVKETAKPLAGTLTTAGAVAKQANKSLAGAISSAGAIVKTTYKPLAGTLTSAGTAAKGLYLSLAGTLASSGAVATLLNPILEAIYLTLRARSVAFSLVSRGVALVLGARSTDFTLEEREEN